jgi:ABC-type multidrug transport system fused ATPase/permease subunit
MYPFSRLVKEIVEEKEERIKEGMKTMGLTDTVFWWSWIITYIIIYGFTAFINTCVLAYGGVFVYTGSNVIFVYLLCFALSMIALACLISTFFSKAKLAGVLSIFIFFAIFLPYV